jgi:hypothetical protein
MAARTANPSFDLLPSSPTRSERLVVSDPPVPPLDEPLGVFRGLAFAIVFQLLVGIVGYAGWVLLHHLR